MGGYGVHKGYIPDRYNIYSGQAPYQLHKQILESHGKKWRGFASGHVFTPTPVTQVVVTQVTQVITPSQKMRGSIVSLIGVAQIVSAVVSPIGGIQSPVAGKFFPSLVTLSAFPPALPRKTLRALKSALPRKRQKFQFLRNVFRRFRLRK